MSGAENDRLHDERDDDPQTTVSEAVADEGGTRNRYGAEERLFPEPRLKGPRNRREPR